MTCSDFLTGFSDYFDGAASEDDLRAAEEHLSSCPSCRRYREVVERGSDLLRTLPRPQVPEDFRPRLQHRLYHVDAEGLLGGPANSGATGVTVVAMALVLAAVAWVPTLKPSAPEVELPAIEVSTPPAALRYRMAPAYPFNARRTSRMPAENRGVTPADLWNDAPGLLFRYSVLSHRYRSSSLHRAGFEEDR